MKTIFRIALYAATFMMAFAASAATLSPQEALARARNKAVNGRRLPQSSMQLAATIDSSNSEPAIYVYTPEDPDAPGFVILSADDSVTRVLGYSDDSFFRTDDIPPSMGWWFQACAQRIEEASITEEGERYPFEMIYDAVAKDPIEPMITTHWNQGAPYYDDCPTINSTHTYTGCVATAMAQVMDYYRYPSKGTGSSSYYFYCNNQSHLDSFNFGATEFDWDEMLNSYGAGATEEEKDAVAELMHACGVASRMQYGLSGSGTNYYYAGAGMINYLGYDKGLKCLDRSWFDDETWINMIYTELAEGRPVLYSGTNNSSGHAFVCDGYSYDDMFHINWGWGGASDGYFLLSELNPYDQGIGGSSAGYESNQLVLINIKPAEEGSELNPILLLGSNFSTSADTYDRSANEQIRFTGSYYNMALGTIPYSIGIKLVDDDNNETYITLKNSTIDSMYGVSSMYIDSADLPEGSYEAFPVFKAPGYDWQNMYFDSSRTQGAVLLDVTPDSVKSHKPDFDYLTEVTTPTTTTADVEYSNATPTYYTLQGVRVDNPANGIFIKVTGNHASKVIL